MQKQTKPTKHNFLCHAGKRRKPCKRCVQAAKTNRVTRCAVIYGAFSKIRLQITELSFSYEAIPCVPSNIESRKAVLIPMRSPLTNTWKPRRSKYRRFPPLKCLKGCKPMQSEFTRRAFTSCRSVDIVMACNCNVAARIIDPPPPTKTFGLNNLEPGSQNPNPSLSLLIPLESLQKPKIPVLSRKTQTRASAS